MRSQITFIMHPDDEDDFVREVLAEPDTVFVDGPKWKTKQPPVLSKVTDGNNFYFMIWNRAETPALTGRHHTKGDDEWWYCENEFLTLQLLRSKFFPSFLTEGRIAVGSDRADPEITAAVDRRYKRLRRWIKKFFTNNIIIWQNMSLPRSGTNPLKPSPTHWIGPHALSWLQGDSANRWVQQFGSTPGKVRGYLIDLVGENESMR
ncbi:MAG: hypothetical protein KDA84_15860 [Planctomycetaceae bacterium]|nr:hypothetical protein [Planctomycetaceae bacterium]